MNFQIGDKEFIPLCDLLKAAGICDTGGQAKHMVAEGLVKVDGVVETRKRFKVRLGMTIQFAEHLVSVVE